MGMKNEWKSATDSEEGGGDGGNLLDETKTWHKGGTQERMAVNLAFFSQLQRQPDMNYSGAIGH